MIQHNVDSNQELEGVTATPYPSAYRVVAGNRLDRPPVGRMDFVVVGCSVAGGTHRWQCRILRRTVGGESMIAGGMMKAMGTC